MKSRGHPINYRDAKVRRQILVSQRREMWTPEQMASFAKHFRLQPGMKLLDAGCGYGYCLRTYGPYCLPGGELVGLDREPALLTTARQMARKEGLGAVVRFVRGDIYRMPFEDNTFDIAMAQVVLCHLAEPEKALDELIRVTRPGGCVAVFDNGAYGQWWSRATSDTPIKEMVFEHEMLLRSVAGRRKLGLGDLEVANHVPGWMEARGMDDVNARANERIFWMAPPYRSPDQQAACRKSKEVMRISPRRFHLMKDHLAHLRAGGVTEAQLCRHRKLESADHRRTRAALSDGTQTISAQNRLWCVWGFKPKAQPGQ